MYKQNFTFTYVTAAEVPSHLLVQACISPSEVQSPLIFTVNEVACEVCSHLALCILFITCISLHALHAPVTYLGSKLQVM